MKKNMSIISYNKASLSHFNLAYLCIMYVYGLRGLSIQAMLPFCVVWLFLVGLPIREYLRKKISTLKAGEYLNILNLLLLILLQFLSVFIMGSAIFLVKILV